MSLSLSKETLAELTADEMAGVVGGQDLAIKSCLAASCITARIVIQTTELCG